MADNLDRYAGELRDLLADSALDEFDGPGEPSERAMYIAAHLAARIGCCRLFAIDLGEDDVVLPVPMAIGAARGAMAWVYDIKSIIDKFPKWWAQVRDVADARTSAVGLIESRLLLWGVGVALKESALVALRESEPDVEELYVALNELARAVERLDEKLNGEGIRAVLSTIADLPLFDTWRNSLVLPYSDPMPYWLQPEYVQGMLVLLN